MAVKSAGSSGGGSKASSAKASKGASKSKGAGKSKGAAKSKGAGKAKAGKAGKSIKAGKQKGAKGGKNPTKAAGTLNKQSNAANPLTGNKDKAAEQSGSANIKDKISNATEVAYKSGQLGKETGLIKGGTTAAKATGGAGLATKTAADLATGNWSGLADNVKDGADLAKTNKSAIGQTIGKTGKVLDAGTVGKLGKVAGKGLKLIPVVGGLANIGTTALDTKKAWDTIKDFKNGKASMGDLGVSLGHVGTDVAGFFGGIGGAISIAGDIGSAGYELGK